MDDNTSTGAGEAAPEITAADPMVEQVRLTFLSNSKGATVEVQIPNGGEMNERNMLHVMAWYITNAFGQLLPVAINSWHAQRLAMLRKGPEGAAYGQLPGVPDEAPNDPGGSIETSEREAVHRSNIAGANGPKLLGADGGPLTAG